MMNTNEFLFPRDLEVTETKLEKILLIGSCLSTFYRDSFVQANPGLVCDYIAFNNAANLPTTPPSPIETYQLQYIQIPIRTVISDDIIRFGRILDPDFHAKLIERARRNLEQCLDAALTYNKMHGLLSIVTGFFLPQGSSSLSLAGSYTELDLRYIVARLNADLAARVRTYKNVYFADVDMVASSLGKRFFLDDVIYFYSHGALFWPQWSRDENSPFWSGGDPGRIEPVAPLENTYPIRGSEFFEAMFRQMVCIYRVVHQIDMVKVVIFDLDNTMWRGQIGEHYENNMTWPNPDGWPMGVWEAIHHLKARGIVTTIASKNDIQTVTDKWSDAVRPLFVEFTDFLNPKINWRPKAENIAQILAELSLTPKSALFVDDNPIERESVRAALPGIRVIGADPFLTRRILLWAPETQTASITEESRNREAMLKKQMQRETDRVMYSRAEFLASLETRISFIEIVDPEQKEFARVFELTNKTNQFNTNGQRWTSQQVVDFLKDNGRIIAFTVTDIYTDYGLVGVVFVRNDTIVQFLMSCRVLGMDIEVKALDHVVSVLRSSAPVLPITATITHTDANTACRDMYLHAGFDLAGTEGSSCHFLLPAERAPAVSNEESAVIPATPPPVPLPTLPTRLVASLRRGYRWLKRLTCW